MKIPIVVGAKLRAAAARIGLSAINRAKNALLLLKRFCLLLKDIWLWLWEPHLVYISVFVVALPIGVFFYCPHEDIIRWTGLIFQLLGIGTVWWGIEETRKLFGHPPFQEQARQWARQWLQARPPFRRDVTVEVGAASPLSVRGFPPPYGSMPRRTPPLNSGFAYWRKT